MPPKRKWLHFPHLNYLDIDIVWKNLPPQAQWWTKQYLRSGSSFTVESCSNRPKTSVGGKTQKKENGPKMSQKSKGTVLSFVLRVQKIMSFSWQKSNHMNTWYIMTYTSARYIPIYVTCICVYKHIYYYMYVNILSNVCTYIYVFIRI